MFIFTQDMAENLRKIREQCKLSQKEVGVRMGIRKSSAQSFIAQLESGLIKNPSLKTILDYLSVCNYSWSQFFSDLSAIQFKLSHKKIIRQVKIPKYHKKIERDVAKYTHSIQTKFAQKQRIKPLTLEKQDKMALGFLKHRVIIEQIEQEITSLLANTQEPAIVNQFYKAFARECYRILKKHSDASRANQKINQTTEKWIKQGLKKELLAKVKEKLIKYIESIEPNKCK